MKRTFWQETDRIIGPATVAEFDTIGQQDVRNAIERFVIDHSDKSTSLLDAGCNTGVEGYRLFEKEYAGKYVGVDSNQQALDHAAENLQGHIATFLLADLEQIAYADQSFDIVLTKDVIEHAEHYSAILCELARLSRQWLILSMFIKMHGAPDHIHREPEGYHHNRYNRAALYDLMQRNDFSLDSILYRQDSNEVLLFKRQSG